MTGPTLRLEGIHHAYSAGSRRFTGGRGADRHPVLVGVDLEVRAGEIVGVCGPSGAGKSTLLRIAAGLERPSRGIVWADGRVLWAPRSTRPAYPRAGWATAIFQDPAGSLDPAWTIRRTLEEPFHAAGRTQIGRLERSRRIDAVLEDVGLGSVPGAARPAQLSGGQQQRIALARCLLADPSVLLADEPTSALDVTNAAGVMHLLRATARGGVAILLVSHDRAMLGALADRVLECRHGRLETLGSYAFAAGSSPPVGIPGGG